MDKQITWYGPHACDVCGTTIVKAAREDGGAEFEPPTRLLRVFHHGAESGDPQVVYPQPWVPHEHRTGPSGSAPTSPAAARAVDPAGQELADACMAIHESAYIEMQTIDDILNMPCGRCGDPSCFGGCEVGADEPPTPGTPEAK